MVSDTQVPPVRTAEEIVSYYQAHGDADLLGFEADVLLPYLTFDQARQFLVPDAVAEQWEHSPLTREQILADMADYMAFAWGKVRDHRGISASRSVEKMATWLWLLQDEPTRDYALNGEHYAQYGAPILARICQVYGFPIPDGEDLANMAAGRPCYPGCTEGCGE